MKALDGPAAGVALSLRRLPRFLRLVVDADGKWDALDQLDDEPATGELVHVYRRVSQPVRALVRARGRCSWVQFADYVHVPSAPASELRGRAAWRAWAKMQDAAIADVVTDEEARS